MRRRLFLGMTALLALAGAAPASDPVGIYGLIDKVVMEPGRGDAERVRIFGVFRLAKPRSGGEEYQPAAYGYLYYTLAPGKAAESRREWADLKSVEHTGQVVAFASRYQKLGTVRKVAERPEKPDEYPVENGLEKINGSGIAKELRSFVIPNRPIDGGVADEKDVALSAHVIADKERRDVKYLFEISDGDDHKESSDPRQPDNELVKWKPKMKLKAGEKYTWRVWAVSGDWKGPVTVATFKGK
jgi:hypothetical protein